MSNEENRRLVDGMMQALVHADAKGIQELVTPGWINHDPSLPPLSGRAGAAQLVELFSSAFSNMHFTIEDAVSEGDKVACRFRFGGTNTGSFMGAPPTGKKAEVTATGIFRFENGLATDNWVNFDALGMMQQLGLLPAPPGPA